MADITLFSRIPCEIATAERSAILILSATHESIPKWQGDQGLFMSAVRYETSFDRLLGGIHIGDAALLMIAVLIDFADMLPLELIGIGFFYELPLSLIESFFLMHLGAPPKNALLAGAFDLVPIIDIVPWCTLAVLYKRFGIHLGRSTRLFSTE
jgi:hypothetical protein